MRHTCRLAVTIAAVLVLAVTGCARRGGPMGGGPADGPREAPAATTTQGGPPAPRDPEGAADQADADLGSLDPVLREITDDLAKAGAPLPDED
jgi:hypothetical protein